MICYLKSLVFGIGIDDDVVSIDSLTFVFISSYNNDAETDAQLP